MTHHTNGVISGGVASLVIFVGMTASFAQAQQFEPRASNVDVAVGSNAPLTALSVTSGSVNCTQGRIVVDKTGKLGFLAPVIGPNVLRGSADLGATTSWAVIPLDEVSPEMINAVTACRTAQ